MDLQRLEEIGLNASGPANPRLYDGWLLGFTGGKAKRGRSVNPFYGSSLPIPHKIAACEKLYAAAALPFVVRLTPFAQPAELDGWLAENGYERFDDTLVMTRDLVDWVHVTHAPLERIRFVETDIFDWTVETQGARGLAADQVRRTLDRIDTLRLSGCGLIAQHQGAVAAWGMVQVEDGQAGIYNVETMPQFRRAGLARRLVTMLVDRAHHCGAAGAYLQVTATNAAAAPLYADMGFNEAYRYWYRARPEVIARERG